MGATDDLKREISEKFAKKTEAAIRVVDEGRAVEVSWEGYKQAVLDGAGPVQIQESRRVWYVATLHALLLLKTVTGGDEVDEETALKRIDSIRNECETFINGMGTYGR
jgi:hypothetical protein